MRKYSPFREAPGQLRGTPFPSCLGFRKNDQEASLARLDDPRGHRSDVPPPFGSSGYLRMLSDRRPSLSRKEKQLYPRIR